MYSGVISTIYNKRQKRTFSISIVATYEKRDVGMWTALGSAEAKWRIQWKRMYQNEETTSIAPRFIDNDTDDDDANNINDDHNHHHHHHDNREVIWIIATSVHHCLSVWIMLFTSLVIITGCWIILRGNLLLVIANCIHSTVSLSMLCVYTLAVMVWGVNWIRVSIYLSFLLLNEWTGKMKRNDFDFEDVIEIEVKKGNRKKEALWSVWQILDTHSRLICFCVIWSN